MQPAPETIQNTAPLRRMLDWHLSATVATGRRWTRAHTLPDCPDDGPAYFLDHDQTPPLPEHLALVAESHGVLAFLRELQPNA